MDKFYIIDRLGRICVKDQSTGKVFTRSLSENLDKTEDLVAFVKEDGVITSDQFPYDYFELEFLDAAGLWALRKNDCFIGYDDYGNFYDDREKPQSWEYFFIIPAEKINNVMYLLRGCFLSEQSSIPQKAQITNKNIVIGDEVFSLVDNINYEFENGNQILLWKDMWATKRFFKFNPCVYYCCFGDYYFEQLNVSLESLYEIGRYEGDVVVITDKDFEFVKNKLGSNFRSNTIVINFSALSKFDTYYARYFIHKMSEFNDYSSILYVDCDVVFDENVYGFLMDIAKSNKISAQMEVFSLKNRSDAVGARILNSIDMVAKVELGFNSGILAIPNATRFSKEFDRLIATIRRYAKKNGRGSLSHFDQAIFNYIAEIYPDFMDYSLVTPKVRWFSDGHMRGGDKKLGMTHFWGTPSKPHEMGKYLSHCLNREA